jgi:hypothetical protein
VREQYKFQKQEEGANHAFLRVRNCQTNTTSTPREPLGELDAKQVHNILQGKLHSEADPIDPRPITRKRTLEKPALYKLDLNDRKRYIHHILNLEASKTILISCDETPLEFGGSGYSHVSAPRGVVVYTDEASDPRFTKMQWDAASNDTRVLRPCLIWNREEEEETSALAQRLDFQVSKLKARVDHNKQQASIAGTPQHQLLMDTNAEIASYNASLPLGQRTGRKKRMTIERLFKYEKLIRDHKKGGLDFVWYAFRVYETALFPYYLELRRINEGKDVFIVEDNVGVHHKARRLLADQIHELDIKFLDTPANSPDLQPIEHLHKDQKHELASARFNTTSAAAAVQAQREKEMIAVWQRSETFEKKVKERMAIDYWKGLATRSMQADPPYSNRYKDSL